MFQLGIHTQPVAATMHQVNRQRLLEQLRRDASLPQTGCFVLLMGGRTQNFYNTDTEPVFIQESYFHWTFGVTEPDCFGAIDVASGKSYLFFPKLPDTYAIWMGKLYTLDDFGNRYLVDATFYTEQVQTICH